MNEHDEAAPVADHAAPRQIEIYRLKDAPTLDEHGAMGYELLEDAAGALGRLAELGGYEGADVHVLFCSAGLSLTYAWFKPHYMLPMHAHDSDCLYHVIAGELIMGRETIAAGDGFFLPANAWYSYSAGAEGVEILEFSGTETFKFRARGGIPKHWERLAETYRQNRASWPQAPRPPRRIRD